MKIELGVDLRIDALTTRKDDLRNWTFEGVTDSQKTKFGVYNKVSGKKTFGLFFFSTFFFWPTLFLLEKNLRPIFYLIFIFLFSVSFL